VKRGGRPENAAAPPHPVSTRAARYQEAGDHAPPRQAPARGRAAGRSGSTSSNRASARVRAGQAARWPGCALTWLCAGLAVRWPGCATSRPRADLAARLQCALAALG